MYRNKSLKIIGKVKLMKKKSFYMNGELTVFDAGAEFVLHAKRKSIMTGECFRISFFNVFLDGWVVATDFEVLQ